MTTTRGTEIAALIEEFHELDAREVADTIELINAEFELHPHLCRGCVEQVRAERQMLEISRDSGRMKLMPSPDHNGTYCFSALSAIDSPCAVTVFLEDVLGARTADEMQSVFDHGRWL